MQAIIMRKKLNFDKKALLKYFNTNKTKEIK